MGMDESAAGRIEREIEWTNERLDRISEQLSVLCDAAVLITKMIKDIKEQNENGK